MFASFSADRKNSILIKDDVQIKEFILTSSDMYHVQQLSFENYSGFQWYMYKPSLQVNITLESVKIILYCPHDIIDEKTEIEIRKTKYKRR